MEIQLAKQEDKQEIGKYDAHISRDRLEQCIRDGFVYVLRDGARIVGVLRYSLFWQSIPFLDLIYLADACRGKGYGSRMMAHWETAMAAQYDHVMLSTQADETAYRFYEKLGYRKIGAFLPPDQDAEEWMYLKVLK